MIKVFTLNKNNKIELTKEELESLLNESYWEGYNKKSYWTYTSPYYYGNFSTTNTPAEIDNPYKITCDSNSIMLKVQGD